MKLISKLQNITIWTKTSKVSKAQSFYFFRDRINEWISIDLNLLREKEPEKKNTPQKLPSRMGDKFIIHTDDMRDKVRNPAMNSLILVLSSFSFLYHKRTVLSHCSFPSFFCSHVKLMKATRGTYCCRVHRIQSKPFN